MICSDHVHPNHTYGKKMARKGRTKVIYKGTFISDRSLVLILGLLNEKALLLFLPKIRGGGTNAPPVPMVLKYVLETTFPFIFFSQI